MNTVNIEKLRMALRDIMIATESKSPSYFRMILQELYTVILKLSRSNKRTK